MGRAMAQAVGHRPLTAEARVRFQASPRGICGGQSRLGQVLLRVFLSSPIIIIPKMLHTHSFIFTDAI